MVSSLTAVGPSPDGSLPDESSPCVPITDYGWSKLEAERICRARAGEIQTTIIRPPAVYGPRDKDILEMFRWVSYGIRPVIGSRDKSISLIHARDLASGIVSAAHVPQTSGRTYFLSDERPYRFSDLMDKVASVMEKRTVPLFIPGPALYAIAGIAQTISPVFGRTAVLTVEKARDLLQRYWVCSPAAAQKEFGFASEVGLDEGIKETYDWYVARGWL